MAKAAVVRTTAHGRAWMEFFSGTTLTFRQPSGRCQNHASPAQNPDGSGECLYALKINGEKGSFLVKSDIENVQCSQSGSSKINVIEITIKEPAVHLWAEATKRNIGQAIAIVMDNHVLAAPIVRSVITGGKCMISGNFSQTEMKSIASLGNNGELPINFTIVKF